MLTDIFGMKLPYIEIWLPLVVGMFCGGMCIVMFRAFNRQRPQLVAPPAPPMKQEQIYDPFVQGSPTEQRRSHRRGGNPIEVLLAPNQSTNPEWRGWVLDRSVGGLCLVVPQDFSEGTILRALPMNAPAITPWTELEVRSCRAGSDGFELGCQFIRQPPWSVLLLFG